ncbi:hypothetical protein HNP73_000266 [Amaricoccus macauensis]|uniref:AAA domain-containing protein n=1 Tax=Amaricoccus macauensis TaxID=57001 RepID=A0A840SI38_9RHOB|nr:hypothetical protein [Amaricoccus macauensis]
MTVHDSSTRAGLRTFPSGYGQADTRIRRGTPYEAIDTAAIIAMLSDPPSAPKEQARWFLPSTYNAHDARTHAVQRERGSFCFLVLDVDDNNLALAEVNEALEAVVPGASRLVYSTRSATPVDRRWRALVPLVVPIPGVDYTDTANAFYDLLEESTGGHLIPCRCHADVGQLAYLPNRGSLYEHYVHHARRLDLSGHPIIARRDECRRQRAEAEAAARAKREQRARDRAAKGETGESPVEHFNRTHSIAELLEHYGYSQAGSTDDWRSPYQSSGSYATRDCGEHWVSLSQSDAANGIGAESKSGRRFGDAFDLYVHFEHLGDFAKAVRAYAREAGLNARPSDDSFAGGADFGWEAKQNRGDTREEKASLFRSWRPIDPLTFPPRCFLYGKHYIRKFASVTVAPPGIGKSTLDLIDALAMATGRQLIGVQPVQRLRVVYFNAEDPREEIERRVLAACQHFDIDQAELEGRLFTASGREVDLILARGEAGDIVEDAFALVTAFYAEFKPDVLIFDPLANMTESPETNDVFRRLGKRLSHLADECDCAIEVVHHTRKLGGREADIEDSRGGSALVGAVRSGRVLNPMTADEAVRAGLSTHIDHFRIDRGGKSNVARPSDRAVWFRKFGVELPNGDDVAVVEPWEWPDAFEGVSLEMTRKVRTRLAEQDPPARANSQAKEWAGYIIAEVVGIDASDKASRARISQMIRTWLRTGVLQQEERRSPRDGRDIPVILPGPNDPSNPEMP